MSSDASDLVAAVLGLPGVAYADVDTGDEPGVAVRVSLTPGADGRAVADAVSRTLHERLGSGAAPARVHVLDDEPVAPAVQVPVQGTVRPSIVRLVLTTTPQEHVTTVALTSRTRAATGEGRSVATAQGLRRSAAAATLRALERLLQDRVRLELEQVELTPNGTLLVTVTMLSPRGPEELIGSASAGGDEHRAVVRATLDALNRRLEALLV